MTDNSQRNTQRLIEETRQARDQAAIAKNEVQDLNKTLDKVATNGDPRKASTTDLITGNY